MDGPAAANLTPSGGRFAAKVARVVGPGMAADSDISGPRVGAAISLLLAREGRRVGVVGNGRDGAARTVGLIRAEGGEAFPIRGRDQR